MSDGANGDAHPREIAGRFVLLCFVGFFGVIFAANVVLVKLASSSFGGLETGSAYQAGLRFKHEIAAARAQNALNWHVNARLSRAANGSARLHLVVRDAEGQGPAGLSAVARLRHPANSHRDRQIELWPQATGAFVGEAEIDPGHWDVVIDILRAGERVYRSESRALLP